MGQVLTLADAAGGRPSEPPAAVAMTNGHFDLLHVGHVRYLQAARASGRRADHRLEQRRIHRRAQAGPADRAGGGAR